MDQYAADRLEIARPLKNYRESIVPAIFSLDRCAQCYAVRIHQEKMVEEGGFEPPKRDATDLQSAPFGHSGTPPFMELVNGRSRASRVSTACGTAAAPFLSENLPPADFPNDKTLSGFESVSKLLDV